MSVKHQKVEIPLGPGFTPSQRRKIGEELIDVMITRTENGYGVYGGKKRKFPGYSETYINSLDFKIAGKSPGDINLKLSGDMLAAIEILEVKDRAVVIGFREGSDENARADGNIRGSYGGSPNAKRARSFLGVTESELESVISKYERD